MANPALSKADLESGTAFAPRFDDDGLMGAIVQDAESGDVLMFAFMNETALAWTLKTGEAHFWSRSRQVLWRKGETSGNVLRVVEMRTDCDQDCMLLRVRIAGDGAACHTGRKSCFYRRVQSAETGAEAPSLVFLEE